MDATKTLHFDSEPYDAIINANKNNPGALLTVLEEAQKVTPHQYLPEPVLRHIAERMNVPLSRINSIVTFYSFFNLKPQGDHTITVCRGLHVTHEGQRPCLRMCCLNWESTQNPQTQVRSPLTTCALPSEQWHVSDNVHWLRSLPLTKSYTAI